VRTHSTSLRTGCDAAHQIKTLAIIFRSGDYFPTGRHFNAAEQHQSAYSNQLVAIHSRPLRANAYFRWKVVLPMTWPLILSLSSAVPAGVISYE